MNPKILDPAMKRGRVYYICIILMLFKNLYRLCTWLTILLLSAFDFLACIFFLTPATVFRSRESSIVGTEKEYSEFSFYYLFLSPYFFFFLYTFAPNRFVQNLTKYAMWSSIFFFLMKKKKKKKRANNSQKKKRKDIIYRFTVLPRDNRTQVDVQQSVFVLNLRSLHNEKE